MSSFIVDDLSFEYNAEIDSPKKESILINQVVDLFDSQIIELKRNIIFLNNEYVTSYSKSPLLLPFENFNLREMTLLSNDVFASLHRNKNKKDVLKSLKNNFDFRNAKIKISIKNKQIDCYRNNGLIFKSPGKHKHGIKQLSLTGTHIETCYINGTYRFGGKIVVGFHYDCTNNQGGNVNKMMMDCCGLQKNYNKIYVNIYPNDFIR